MQITVNLSSTPYLDVEPLIRKLRIVAIFLGSLTLCAAVLLGLAHYRKSAYQKEQHQLDGAIARESDELSSYHKMLEMPENVSIANRTLALNSLFDEKSFSWTMLMKQFEGLVPPEVQLATIQPIRAKDGSISIRMHVIGPREKVIELIHGIESSKNFSLPHVTAETAHSDAGPSRRAVALTASSVEEFDIEAGYDEDALSTDQHTGDVPANRETASTVSVSTESRKAAPAEMTATVVPSTAVQAGGAR
jgi:type IV pilus assembly protein PilN